MSDLTDEQLEGMDMWDRDVMLNERHCAAGSMLVRMAVAEIRGHRAARRADAAHIAKVVRSELHGLVKSEGLIEAVANRVAEQLAAPALAPGREVTGETLQGFADAIRAAYGSWDRTATTLTVNAAWADQLAAEYTRRACGCPKCTPAASAEEVDVSDLTEVELTRHGGGQ